MGVVAAVLKILNFWTGVKVGYAAIGNGTGRRGEIIALLMYLGLATYMFWDARRARAEG